MGAENFAPEADPYIFTMPGHGGYDLTDLQTVYGTRFCERIERSWNRAYGLRLATTSYATFKHTRTMFLRIAEEGLKCPDSAIGRVYVSYRDSQNGLPAQRDWDETLEFFRSIFMNLDDRSFIDSALPNSRNKYVETINAGFGNLYKTGFVRNGRIKGRFDYILDNSRVETIAGLMRKAGRLQTEGLGEVEYAKKFIQANRESLSELRRCLSKEFEEAWAVFEHGQSIMADPGLPSLNQITERLRDFPFVPTDFFEVEFGLNSSQSLALVAILVRHVVHLGNQPPMGEKKYRALVNSVGGDDVVQSKIEGTSVALHAVFHIIMIDTELNTQPIKDFPADPFVATAKRGERQVQTLEGKKNRAQGKSVEGHIASVTAKTGPDGIAGDEAIRRWQIMSAPLRKLLGDVDSLWAYRKASSRTATLSIKCVDDEWRYEFLKRIRDNPVIGGLAISARVIIRTCRNRRGANAEFDFELQMALANHSGPEMAFHYLDRNAVRKLLENAIRTFLDAWEAAAVSTIDEGAKLLGVADSDFARRRQLGLENGLEFAAVLRGDDESGHAADGRYLPENMTSMHLNQRSLQNLIVVRMALNQQMEHSLARNPGRFVQFWLPWLALVEGYCTLIAGCRLRREFDAENDNVLRDIDEGKRRLPLLW